MEGTGPRRRPRHAPRSSAARRGEGTPRATPGTWAIFEGSERTPYLDVGFRSRADAEVALADLLQPYPAGSRWRQALRVARVADADRERLARLRAAALERAQAAAATLARAERELARLTPRASP